ncbi:Helix-turn-helix domain-containing protein [Rhodospirillales bacterium URHD0017]|nr:Helix-turn-helix domain-containing protein [Rhodospirillales bacterium URHD0017]
MSTPDDQLLTSDQAAAILGLQVNTLEIWRFRGQGPRFLKLGTRKQSPVRYKRSDVESWLAQRTFASTSAYSAIASS